MLKESNMPTITVNASKKYNVMIESGLLEDLGVLILEAATPKKVCVVSDTTVYGLFGDIVLDSLKNAGVDVNIITLAPGEETKSLSNLKRILEYLADHEYTRTDCLIALGGGVIGDLTGFAAAVYLRGIPFIQVPTTLLAAVDSSVGGKTAVNLSAGKNLAGAFWQPSLVVFDMDTVLELPEERFKEGISEIVKSAVIGDAGLFDYLQTVDNPRILDFVARCVPAAVTVKRDLVQADERDKGLRKLLNFGHTMAHGIEKVSGFEITHGQAVAMGMLACAKAAARKGWSNRDCTMPIAQVLEKYGIDPSCSYDAKDLAEAALNDKKRSGDNISIVVPLEIGNAALMDIPVSQLEDFFKAGL